VATALSVHARPGLRITARDGWLLTAPTGRTVACAGLSELVAAARVWLTVPDEFTPSAAGTVCVPGPDARGGLRVTVDPDARPVSLGAGSDILVPDTDAADHVYAQLAGPPWSLRHYLAPDPGVVPHVVGPSPDCAADLLVWVEMVRPGTTELVARCPIEGSRWVDIEVRSGHVVRARVAA
jgi:hypothetical protein